MTAPQSTPPPVKPKGANRKGLNWKEWVCIATLLAVGVGLAALLMFEVPTRMVSEQDYRCPSADTASSQAAASGVSPSCLGRAGADGIDDQALGQARAAVRAPFGVLSAGLLAGAAAAIGVVVSNHNAALTRGALDATVETNKITKDRDEGTAARERERAADERFTTAIGQLGHPSASVRLGGIHSLHRLGLRDSERRLTVLDVLCAYLRQPFHHSRHDWNPGQDLSGAPRKPNLETPARAWWPANQKEQDERDSEGEVRRTAARLIPTLLPLTANPSDGAEAPTSPAVNLSNAVLDDLNLSGRRTGTLVLDGAYIDGDLRLGAGVHIDGDLRLGGGAHIAGNLLLSDGACIEGAFHLDGESRIVGDIHLDTRAYVSGDLVLSHAGCVAGSFRLDNGAHIDGAFRTGTFAHVEGDVLLSSKAYILGGISLDYLSAIHGVLLLDTGAYIGGELRLGVQTAIVGGVELGMNTHIDGALVLVREDCTLGRAWVHPDAATDLAWFSRAGIKAEIKGDKRMTPGPSFSKAFCTAFSTPA